MNENNVAKLATASKTDDIQLEKMPRIKLKRKANEPSSNSDTAKSISPNEMSVKKVKPAENKTNTSDPQTVKCKTLVIELNDFMTDPPADKEDQYIFQYKLQRHNGNKDNGYESFDVADSEMPTEYVHNPENTAEGDNPKGNSNLNHAQSLPSVTSSHEINSCKPSFSLDTNDCTNRRRYRAASLSPQVFRMDYSSPGSTPTSDTEDLSKSEDLKILASTVSQNDERTMHAPYSDKQDTHSPPVSLVPRKKLDTTLDSALIHRMIPNSLPDSRKGPHTPSATPPTSDSEDNVPLKSNAPFINLCDSSSSFSSNSDQRDESQNEPDNNEVTEQTDKDSTDSRESRGRNLYQDLKNLFLYGEDYDLTLRVKDTEFQVHRIILKARSKVFASMLKHDTAETSNGVVEVPDCDPQVMEQFLLHLYCDKLDVLNESNVLGLYHLSDKYDMLNLKEDCRNFIQNSISPSNICDMFQFAITHSDDILRECAIEFFLSNASDILQTAEWVSALKANPNAANELFMIAWGKKTGS